MADINELTLSLDSETKFISPLAMLMLFAKLIDQGPVCHAR
jgi:hypothetical protein